MMAQLPPWKAWNKQVILTRELAAAEEIAREIGVMLKAARKEEIASGCKPNGEVVTPFDVQANATIEGRLRAMFAEDAIYSEESPDDGRRLSRPRVWIVDPIDSTSNFVGCGDEFTISIGLAINGSASAGVVYNPVREEMYSGAVGMGVALNGRRVQVSQVSRLEMASILVSTKEWQRGLETLGLPFRAITMSSMAYKLARVASGLNDGVFTVKRRKQWGTCAGVALVVAAGGGVTLLNGEPVQFSPAEWKQPTGFVASGLPLHPVLLRTIAESLKTQV